MRNLKNNELSSLHGIGVGLRAPHVLHILKEKPNLDWFELLADNHIVEGGWLRRQAVEVANIYPITMHCVGMSLGSVDPINFDYLKKIKGLADEISPKLISDHLCWTSLDSHYSHDLLPLPYTEEALDHIVNRVIQIQEFLNVQIAVENVSAYLTYQHSTIGEVEFINTLAKKADCHILFDINNLYVNYINNEVDIDDYIDSIDLNRVAEVHLAGFDIKENYYLDAHNNPVHDDVWGVYKKLVSKKNDLPTLIEWDHDIPEFSVLYEEALKASRINESSKYQREKHELAIAG